MLIRSQLVHSFRKTGKAALILFFAINTVIATAQQLPHDSLKFEILMSKTLLQGIGLTEKFIPAIEYTPGRFMLIAGNNQFYLLGWGGIKPFAQKFPGSVSDFAYTSEKALMVVKNNELSYFDQQGNLATLYKLPYTGMGIASGTHVMYLFDRGSDHPKHALYVLAKGGRYSKLFEIPTPIQCAAESNNNILFASGNNLFSFNLKSKNLTAVSSLPGEQQIVSIATDTVHNRVYFSSDKGIFSLKDGKAAKITDQLGGVLKCFDDGLLVFNAGKNVIMHISGLENELTAVNTISQSNASRKPAADTLTNNSIINMAEAKLSDDFIINLINKSEVNFVVNIDAMIELSAHNVSSAVISVMKATMKRKSND